MWLLLVFVITRLVSQNQKLLTLLHDNTPCQVKIIFWSPILCAPTFGDEAQMVTKGLYPLWPLPLECPFMRGSPGIYNLFYTVFKPTAVLLKTFYGLLPAGITGLLSQHKKVLYMTTYHVKFVFWSPILNVPLLDIVPLLDTGKQRQGFINGSTLSLECPPHEGHLAPTFPLGMRWKYSFLTSLLTVRFEKNNVSWSASGLPIILFTSFSVHFMLLCPSLLQ